MSEVTPLDYQNISLANLEMQYIDEYLQSKGYRMKDLCNLPETEAKQMMIEACKYASGKLADMEAKARFRQKIRGPS